MSKKVIPPYGCPAPIREPAVEDSKPGSTARFFGGGNGSFCVVLDDGTVHLVLANFDPMYGTEEKYDVSKYDSVKQMSRCRKLYLVDKVKEAYGVEDVAGV